MPSEARNLHRLHRFVRDMTTLVDAHAEDETTLIREGTVMLRALISHDDWLPPEYAAADPDTYQQYLLYCDPKERFSVASFVWGPTHKTPIHDHTVWGLVGVMRGAERCYEYTLNPSGAPTLVTSHLVRPGDVDVVSPTRGDIHVVENASDGVSVSIHVYGANIGTLPRHTYDAATGKTSSFVSGYVKGPIQDLVD